MVKQELDRWLKDNNPTITCLAVNGTASNSKVFLRCTCTREWSTPQRLILSGTGCKSCKRSANTRVLMDKGLKEYKALCKSKQLKLLGEYKGALVATQHQCLKCNYEFPVRPNDVRTADTTKGNRCPHCRKALVSDRFSHPFSYTKQRLLKTGLVKVLGSDKVLDKNGHLKVKVKCKSCGAVSYTGIRLWSGKPCPGCNTLLATKYTKFKLGRRIVFVQGYEGFALQALIRYGVKPSSIEVVTEGKVPAVPVEYSNRAYKADIFLPKENLLVEVKSTYYFGLLKNDSSAFWFDRCKAKVKAAKDKGFRIQFWIFTPSGKKVTLPKGWTSMTHPEICSWYIGTKQ